MHAKRTILAAVCCCAWLLAPAPAPADIFRWDNHQLIPGTEGIIPGPGVQLDHRVLAFAMLDGLFLTSSNFEFSDLSYADLSSSALTNVNFSGAVVTGADFSNTTSTGFTKQQLYSTAGYQQKSLPGIRLSSNDLAGWDFSGQNLANVELSYSMLTNADLSGANLSNAGLFGSVLVNANLSGANLSNAVLYASKLDNANFSGAVVTGANFADTTSRGFTKEQLYSTASYQQKNLQGIRLFHSSLRGWDLSGQDLANADLSGSALANANFSGANLSHAYLAYSKLANTNLREANFSNANLTASTLTNADLNGANLSNAVLYGSKLDNANFGGAVVTGADLSGATSRGFTKEQLYSTASYQQKNLQGIWLINNDLTGWDLSGQNLTKAYLRLSILLNTNLSAADTRGAFGTVLADAFTRNAIFPNGLVNGLRLNAGETLVAYPGVPIPVRVASPLAIDAGATFDLSDNVLIVDYTGRDNPADQIATLLERGARGGPTKWDGPGINSRTARDDAAFATALGMIDNGLVGYDTIKDNQFGFGLDGGESVPANAVLVKYTYLGDADLNGRVDGDDLVSFFVGYGAQGRGWANGDFDYSGAIDGDDLTSLLAGYAHQGAPLGAGAPFSAASSLGAVAVPEPRALVLGVCGLAALLAAPARRRRMNRT